jgi:hypothetical protein
MLWRPTCKLVGMIHAQIYLRCMPLNHSKLALCAYIFAGKTVQNNCETPLQVPCTSSSCQCSRCS